MRIIAAVFALMLSPLCAAEEAAVLDALPLEPVQSIGEAAEMDFREIALRLATGGDLSEIGDPKALLKELVGGLKEDAGRILAALIVPQGVSLTVGLVMYDSGAARRTVGTVCRIACAAAVCAEFEGLRRIAGDALSRAGECTEAMTPVLIAAAAVTGAEASAAVMSPASALCTELIQDFLSGWGLALCSAAAIAAAAGNLSGSVKLGRLHALFRQGLHWMLGILMTVFMGTLTLQGKLGAGRDSVAMRTAKYTIESVVPVIGGEMSDSLETILATASMVRNAVGVTGIILLTAVCLIPLAKLAAAALMMKAAAAVSEPLGDDGMTAMLGRFAAAVEMLLVITVAAWLMCALLLGSAFSAANGIF